MSDKVTLNLTSERNLVHHQFKGHWPCLCGCGKCLHSKGFLSILNILFAPDKSCFRTQGHSFSDLSFKRKHTGFFQMKPHRLHYGGEQLFDGQTMNPDFGKTPFLPYLGHSQWKIAFLHHLWENLLPSSLLLSVTAAIYKGPTVCWVFFPAYPPIFPANLGTRCSFYSHSIEETTRLKLWLLCCRHRLKVRSLGCLPTRILLYSHWDCSCAAVGSNVDI